MNNSRNKSAIESLINKVSNDAKESKNIPREQTKDFIPDKKNISELIKKQGSSLRKADSIRINPILSSALVYWTTIGEPNKSKPDIVETALLKIIPEEYLIEGYNLAKKNNKI